MTGEGPQEAGHAHGSDRAFLKIPLDLYEKLVDLYRKGDMDFSSVVAFNLDEYLGLGEPPPRSFAHYSDLAKKDEFRYEF
jgi:hypothetical protein